MYDQGLLVRFLPCTWPLMRLYLLSLIPWFVFVADTAASDDTKIEFFETRIRPVLVEHCYQCHAAKAKNIRGGLLLDSEQGVQAGGDSGAVIVPGKPEESLLIEALRHESFEMPPDQRLPDNVIRDFETWIRDGAVDPRKEGQVLERSQIDLSNGRRFWSFRPVVRPAIPVAGNDWARTDIDRFIAAEYEVHGLEPMPDASAQVVLRRLFFLLTGMPPTPDDIRQFSDRWRQNTDEAIAVTVDELLGSDDFGEHWGRHWLDVVRFAESSGGGRSLMFPEAWRFRDYVIRSLNADKPFDQFVREHIAGDLLPYETNRQHDEQVTGVGYLALGPTNYEQQDKELLRMEVVDEQIDTIGRTFLAMTVGCARCHDHKFDPIPTADYYGLAGILRSTKTLLPGNVSTYVKTSLRSSGNAEQLKVWQEKDAALKAEIDSLRAQVGVKPRAQLAAVNIASLPGVVVDDSQAVFEGEWVASTSVAVYVNAGYKHDAQMRFGRRVRFEAALPRSGEYEVRFAYSPSGNRCQRLPVVVHHAEGTSTRVIDQRQQPSVDGLFTDLGSFRFDAAKKAVVSVNAEDAGNGVVIVDAVQFVPVKKTVGGKKQDVDREQSRQLAKRLKQLEAIQKAHQKDKPKSHQVMSVVDQADTGDWHIHIRGGIRNLGPVVPRSILTVAGRFDGSGNPEPLAIGENESGRRQLAEWLVSPDNPLTARVFVNRVWQHLIGEGLVRTPDNFGSMGQRPTHPELLDFLAHKFTTDDSWSVKTLIRRIATSRVFRLKSGFNDADPDNLQLTHAFRRRLAAEPLRDSILQISGRLNLEQRGGQTIAKLTQYDNGYDHVSYSARLKSVYVPFFRNSMLEFFRVFDIPNPNLVVGRRTVSTLPSQGLFLLNSPFILEHSKAAAEHFLATESGDSEAIDVMIDRATLLTLGRRPEDSEKEILLDYVKKSAAGDVDSWTAVFQALFGSLDFRYLD